MKPRPTFYNGIEMRSRLEASFAQWLDNMGATWVYEGHAYADATGQYLPDFTLQRVGCTFGGFHQWRTVVFDVKPHGDDAVETLERMRRVWASAPDVVLAVVWSGQTTFRAGSGPWRGVVLESAGQEPIQLFYGRSSDCLHLTFGDGFSEECAACFLEAKGR